MRRKFVGAPVGELSRPCVVTEGLSSMFAKTCLERGLLLWGNDVTEPQRDAGASATEGVNTSETIKVKRLCVAKH